MTHGSRKTKLNHSSVKTEAHMQYGSDTSQLYSQKKEKKMKKSILSSSDKEEERYEILKLTGSKQFKS